MRILITNDDGIHAAGLKALADAASRFGQVKVVAPDRERSCCGHAMTMRDPLRVKPHLDAPYESYEVSGVPVDCVNVGLTLAYPDGCDLVLSGFNHGPNLGYDITYSGTVAGAMEGAINGIRSISLSIAAFDYSEPLKFSVAQDWLMENWDALMSYQAAQHTFLNVNVPNLPFSEIKGVRVVPMARRVYEDRVELRDDPWGTPYYWQGGVAIVNGHDVATDFGSVREGYVSVTPLRLDWTDQSQLNGLELVFKTGASNHAG